MIETRYSSGATTALRPTRATAGRPRQPCPPEQSRLRDRCACRWRTCDAHAGVDLRRSAGLVVAFASTLACRRTDALMRSAKCSRVGLLASGWFPHLSCEPTRRAHSMLLVSPLAALCRRLRSANISSCSACAASRLARNEMDCGVPLGPFQEEPNLPAPARRSFSRPVVSGSPTMALSAPCPCHAATARQGHQTRHHAADRPGGPACPRGPRRRTH